MGYTRTGSRGYMSGSPGTITGNLTVTGTVSASELEATSIGSNASPSIRVLDSSLNVNGLYMVSDGNLGVSVGGTRTMLSAVAGLSLSTPVNTNSYKMSYPGTPQTTNYAVATSYGGHYQEHDATAGAFTATLPATPTNGQIVVFQEVAGLTTAVTIARNGRNIYGVASDLTLTTAYGTTALRYSTANLGWFTA